MRCITLIIALISCFNLTYFLQGPLATCFTCDEAYHYYCHSPRIIIPKSNSKWQCNDCVQKQYKTNINQSITLLPARPDTPTNPSVLPPVLSPQVSPARGSSDQMEDDSPRDGIDPNIPDASDWTSEQVYQYFARLFPKEAEVFRQQVPISHPRKFFDRINGFVTCIFVSGYRWSFFIVDETI